MPECARELVVTVDRAVPRLSVMDAARTMVRPAAGKWSPREIMGHLVDSASNNHQRFVRAMFQDDLVVPGYARDDWVAVQKYQDAPWTELIALWASVNRHIARVMSSVPEAIRLKPHTRHSLDRIAFRPVSAEVPATLDYFMNDYGAHLQHHLRQIPGAMEEEIGDR